ncbi:cbb3-type cytochrome c oxidase subunit 3 [Wenzhouxiangella sp. XN24]|uniref:cbb3-type cytochrome oxidase subunit 3 n=1 Tax=Wenzhouxiangella sp. XN24 TaxID=2713569 RepID=UPI003211DB03
MGEGTWHVVWTVLMMTAFIGIVAWAWSSRRRKDFEEAARLPLEEEEQRGPESTPEDEESR